MALERSMGWIERELLSFNGERVNKALARLLSSARCYNPSGGPFNLCLWWSQAEIEGQVSLQVICWPLTRFTVVTFFGYNDLALPAWIVCAITAAISNTIQIWCAFPPSFPLFCPLTHTTLG